MVCGAFCLAVILAALALVLTVRDAVERSLDDRLRSAAATAAAQISGGQVKAVSSTVSTQLVDLASGQVEAASTDLQGRPGFPSLRRRTPSTLSRCRCWDGTTRGSW